MGLFAARLRRLDNTIFDRLGDGTLIIDGVPVPATLDRSSLMFEDARGTERVLTFSQTKADELGLRPKKTSVLQWNGKAERMAMAPIFEDGLVKLVLV
ncbi:hypothetical protein [Vibrio furnissii]|uniref:hypothetical protein n=1 Tax=Vibrio furnissii TaxID=29494 RepID=UPI001EEAA556|nr:hypothetical protein [Vibrio furnissii]MCG6268307.1 hypothetical protein [Vibrio furnissii]